MSSDSEGNNYSEFDEVYFEKGLRYLKMEGYIDLFVKDDAEIEFYNKCKDCTVLYPK